MLNYGIHHALEIFEEMRLSKLCGIIIMYVVYRGVCSKIYIIQSVQIHF